ncbi:hypothetical protein DFH06DRAFT_521156 [Mycena polygramma]|nr:hypothetical protein DFH06DRAFT_521156 [Mycena polygramma]
MTFDRPSTIIPLYPSQLYKHINRTDYKPRLMQPNGQSLICVPVTDIYYQSLDVKTTGSAGRASSSSPLLPQTIPSRDRAGPSVPTEETEDPVSLLSFVTTRLSVTLVDAVNSGIINMCAHALFVAAAPDKYTPSFHLSPLVAAAGIFATFLFGNALASVLTLIMWLVDDDEFLFPLIEFWTPPDESEIPAWIRWALPFIYVCVNGAGAALLSLPMGSLHYPSIKIGVVAGILNLVLIFAKELSADKTIGTGRVVRLCVEAIKSAAIVLSGHAFLAIASPILYRESVNFASTLPAAPLVGALGGAILFCLLDSAQRVSVLDIARPDARRIIPCLIVPFGALVGVAISLVGVGILGLFAELSLLDWQHAACVGAVGGGLMKLMGIRLDVGLI